MMSNGLSGPTKGQVRHAALQGPYIRGCDLGLSDHKSFYNSYCILIKFKKISKFLNQLGLSSTARGPMHGYG